MQYTEGTRIAGNEAEPRHHWGMLAFGLFAGLVGVYVLVVEPMNQRLEAVNRELIRMKRNMDSLVGVAGEASRTNSLLASLKEQAVRVHQAERVVPAISRFRQDVEAEAAKTPAAFASLDRLAALQTSVAGQSRMTDSAVETLRLIQKLHEQILEEGEFDEQATTGLNELISFKRRAMAAGENMDEAKATLAGLVGTE